MRAPAAGRGRAAANVLAAGLLLFAALPPVASADDARDGVPDAAELQDQGPDAAAVDPVVAELERLALTDGTVRVVVGLATAFAHESSLTAQQVGVQRARVDRVARALAAGLGADRSRGVERPELRRLGTLPYVAVEVDAAGLEELLASPHVASVEQDLVFQPSIDRSALLVDAPEMWDAGITGSDWAVAVLDTGVDAAHPLFGDRVVAEACFSTGGSGRTSLCPDGGPSQIGPGASAPCDPDVVFQCGHGTHVAGVVAASGTSSDGTTYAGVAKGAGIIGVQVFVSVPCENDATATCLTASLSDIVLALQHVAELADTIDVAAVNLSFGGGEFDTVCDAQLPSMASAVEALRAKGVGVIAAAGNDGRVARIAAPACLSGAVSVGSTTRTDTMSSFSNAHPTLLDLVAPGSQIRSAFPGSRLAEISGTSFAAPHVAGAWALMRTAYPDASPDDILVALKENGVLVTDGRSGATGVYPRLSLTGLAPDTDPPVVGTGLLRVTTAPAVAAPIRANGVLRTDWGIDWVSVEPGEYEVCFGDVPGFVTPACQTVTVVAGETSVVEGSFQRMGLLKVDVVPSGLPATIYVDGEWRDEYGAFFHLEAGTYEVCFGDVPDHQAPDCQQASVTSGQTTTVVGTFVATDDPTPGPAPGATAFGYLRATTNPAVVSRISVGGVARGDWGLTWVKAPVGDHEVCFTGVPGFAPPPCRTVTVVEGETTVTEGVFTRLGLLRVDVDPSIAVDILVDGVPRNQFGLFVFKPPGTYAVCGTEAAGQTRPACRDVTVTAGELSQTVLTYVAVGSG
jgi:subtilisin family serine protease